MILKFKTIIDTGRDRIEEAFHQKDLEYAKSIVEWAALQGYKTGQEDKQVEILKSNVERLKEK